MKSPAHEEPPNRFRILSSISEALEVQLGEQVEEIARTTEFSAPILWAVLTGAAGVGPFSDLARAIVRVHELAPGLEGAARIATARGGGPLELGRALLEIQAATARAWPNKSGGTPLPAVASKGPRP